MKKFLFSIILIVGFFAATNVYSDQTVSIRNKEGKVLNTTLDKIKPQSKEESAINVRLKSNVSENQKQVVLEKLKKVKNGAVTPSVKDKIITLKNNKILANKKKQASRNNIVKIKSSLSKISNINSSSQKLKSDLDQEQKNSSDILNESKESIEALRQINNEIIDNTKQALNAELSAEEKKTLENVDPNILYQLDESPYLPFDTENNNQWDIKSIVTENPDFFNSSPKDNKLITVAVIDAGVDYNHPDLNANMWSDINCVDDANEPIEGGCKYGYDFTSGDSDPINSDGYDHGTAVASIIGALNDNNLGISSMSQNRVKIMALRVADNGLINMDKLVRSIYFAVNNGAEIINLSLSGPTYSQSVYNALAYANTKNVVVVVSAGNTNSDIDQNKMYPASYNLDNIVTVGSFDQNGAYSSFSNYGKNTVNVAAPGREIWSAGNNKSYSPHTGTSFSAPLVAALIAKWKSEGVSFKEGLSSLKSNQSYLSKVKDGKTITLSSAVNGVPITGDNLSRYIKLPSGKYLDMGAPGGEILDAVPDTLQALTAQSQQGANSGLYSFASTISPGSENYYSVQTINKSDAILRWNGVYGASYTKVYLSIYDPNTDALTSVINEVNSNGYRDVSSMVIPGKTYVWNTGVTAKSAPQFKSEYNYTALKMFKVSDVSSVLAAPTNISPNFSNGPGFTTLNNSMNVSWGAVSGATYYRVVYRDLTTNVLYNSSNIDNKTTNTYFTIRDLQQGHQYRWQVIAYNSSGFSPNSNGSYFTYPVQNTYTPTPGTGLTPVNPTPTSASSIVKILVTDKSGTPVPSQIIKVQGYNSFAAPIGTLKTYTTDTSGSIIINKNDIDKNAAKIIYYKEDMRACSGGICTGDKTELFVANKTVNSTYNLNNVDITNFPVILVPGIMGSTIDNPISIVPRLGKYTNSTTKTYDPSKLFLADASGEWKVNIIGNVANFIVDFTKGEELGWDLMIKKLERNGYINGKTIIVCPYDWSADIPFIVNNYFKACVNKGLANTSKGKVDVIAHSMGGLVTRAYVQEVGKTNGKNIRKIAFLGTPHLGASEAYPVWANGYVDKSFRNPRSLILSSFYRDRGYSVPQTPTQYANQNITFSSTVAVLPYDINSNLFTTTYLAENPVLVYDFLRKENALGLKALVPVYPFLKVGTASTYSQTKCYENTFLKALNGLPTVGSTGCPNPDKRISYSFKDFKSTLTSDAIETKMIYGSDGSNSTLTYLPLRTTKGTKMNQDGVLSDIMTNINNSATYKTQGDQTVPNKSTKEYFESIGLSSVNINVPSEHSKLPKLAQTQTLQFITGKTTLQELELSEIDTNTLSLSVPPGVSLILKRSGKTISPNFDNKTNTGVHYTFSNLSDSQYTLEMDNASNNDYGITFQYISGQSANMATVYKKANDTNTINFGLNSGASINQPMLLLSLSDAPSLEPLKALLEEKPGEDQTQTNEPEDNPVPVDESTNNTTPNTTPSITPTTPRTQPSTTPATPEKTKPTTTKPTNTTKPKTFTNISSATKYYLPSQKVALAYCKTKKYTKYTTYTAKDLKLTEKNCTKSSKEEKCTPKTKTIQVIANITCSV